MVRHCVKQQAISTEKITFNENVFFKDAYRCSYFALMIYLRDTETQRENLGFGKMAGIQQVDPSPTAFHRPRQHEAEIRNGDNS